MLRLDCGRRDVWLRVDWGNNWTALRGAATGEHMCSGVQKATTGWLLK